MECLNVESVSVRSLAKLLTKTKRTKFDGANLIQTKKSYNCSMKRKCTHKLINYLNKTNYGETNSLLRSINFFLFLFLSKKIHFQFFFSEMIISRVKNKFKRNWNSIENFFISCDKLYICNTRQMGLCRKFIFKRSKKCNRCMCAGCGLKFNTKWVIFVLLISIECD